MLGGSELMPTRYLQFVNPQSTLARWAWGPVIMLRVSLVTTYLAYVYAGIVAVIKGVPVLDFTNLPGYEPIWASILAVSAAVAAVGSLTDRWQKVERIAGLVLSAMMLAYIGGLNLSAWVEQDVNRAFVGAIALIAGILPIARFVYLAAQTGKIRVAPSRKR